MAKNRERSTNVYLCDIMWVVAKSLGNELPRYSEIIDKKQQQQKEDNKNTQQVVDGIVNALRKDIERRLKNGESCV